MKGYHALMRLGHMFNVLARYSERMAKVVKDTGVRGLIRHYPPPFFYSCVSTAYPRLLFMFHSWVGKKQVLICYLLIYPWAGFATLTT